MNLSMHVLSINIGTEQTITHGKKTTTTGIYKKPVRGPVLIQPLGLAGDCIVDSVNHGGPDQAVYLYGRDDYNWWEDQLERPIPNGMFGENLTIQHLECTSFAIGDRFHIGTTILEITCPRIPCSKIAEVMGDPQFVKKFRQAERPGIYCRVIQTGQIAIDDVVTHVPFAGDRITILESYRCFFDKNTAELAVIDRFLAAPIDGRSRTWLTAAREKSRL